MSIMKQVYEEYERLKNLFTSVDDSKTELIDELLKRAAFLKVELEKLETRIKSNGAILVSSKGNEKLSITYKTYLSSINTYQTIIRTLNTIMGKNIIDEDDEFDEFLKSAQEK